MLVMRMMVVLVVLMVLEELVVFVGGIFENGISTIFFCRKFLESKQKIFGAKKIKKSLRQSQKSTFT